MPNHTLTLTDSDKSIIVTSHSLIPIESTLPRQFMADMAAMNSRVAISTFNLSPIAGFNNKFLYKFVARDGREWNQTLRFSGGVFMTFSIGEPGWELDEFTLQRPIRETCISLVRDFGCDSISVVFI